MIRVVVAEDSVTVRELLVSILQSDPEFEVVGQAKNGAEAIELAARLRPDLLTMDVHMPLMDGFEATKEIMVKSPLPIIIVSASTDHEGVGLSFHALRAGALMIVPKPTDPRSALFDEQRAQFLSMAKAMAEVKVVRRWAPRPAPPALPTTGAPRFGSPRCRVVAIAASTGGPAALQRILSGLPADFPVPIVVVQHIAHGFVEGLTSWLASACGLHVKVAEESEELRPRTVYIAPDGWHLGVHLDVHRGGRVALSRTAAIGGFRPSGTHLFESLAAAYGAGMVAVILTGMGRDGVAGLQAVKAAGGMVLAQDAATSVVFGMPSEAISAGVVDAVLPLDGFSVRLAALATAAEPRDPSMSPHKYT